MAIPAGAFLMKVSRLVWWFALMWDTGCIFLLGISVSQSQGSLNELMCRCTPCPHELWCQGLEKDNVQDREAQTDSHNKLTWLENLLFFIFFNFFVNFFSGFALFLGSALAFGGRQVLLELLPCPPHAGSH